MAGIECQLNDLCLGMQLHIFDQASNLSKLTLIE